MVVGRAAPVDPGVSWRAGGIPDFVTERAADRDAHVELESVRLAFGERRVFDDLSCRFARARITVLMGGSGTGKSTVLRMIGGLLRPDSGVVRVAGEDVASASNADVERVRRRLGMLFQHGALLDSMSVLENVGLPLHEHTLLSDAEIRDAVHDRLEAVGLKDVDELLPGELSGGMLRRVALARAIIMDPEIVLCDEPFSGLDPPNVERIEALFQQLCRERGLTLIVTSHHMASSLRMSDQIVLLRHGRAVTGTPSEFATSSDAEILDFLGSDGALLAKQVVAEQRP
jgi:phospholipid/cholesterol/gamma-HCH transport system ATP-binding protein